jgi:hypothetical protein
MISPSFLDIQILDFFDFICDDSNILYRLTVRSLPKATRSLSGLEAAMKLEEHHSQDFREPVRNIAFRIPILKARKLKFL